MSPLGGVGRRRQACDNYSDNSFGGRLKVLGSDSDRFVASGVPASLLATMFRASNGGVAWPIETAGEAIAWIASERLAIVGGETWLLDDDDSSESLSQAQARPPLPYLFPRDRIIGQIPVTGSSIPAVRGWSVTSRQSDESWGAFVGRCRTFAGAALRSEAERIHEEVPTNLHGRLRYNLTAVSEQEYTEL